MSYEVECAGASLAGDRVVSGDLEHEDRVGSGGPFVAVGGRHDPVLLGAAQKTHDRGSVGDVFDLEVLFNNYE